MPAPVPDFAAKKLRALRLEQKMSQQELAAKAGLVTHHISRLERGLHKPSRATVAVLAKALAVAPADLLRAGRGAGRVRNRASSG